MPSDTHDPSPAKARRLRIVRGMLLSIAILLPLAAIAAIVGWFATGVFEGEVQVVEVEKVTTVEIEKVVTVEVLVEIPVEKITTVEFPVEVSVEKIVVATPTPTLPPTLVPCPSDAEREYLTSLGERLASRDNAAAEYNKVWHLLDDDAAFYLQDSVWQESIRTKATEFRGSVYDIMTLRSPLSAQGIQNHMVDWARYELAGFDLLVRHLDAESVAELRDSLDQRREAVQQHVQSRDASRALAFEAIAELCDSPSALIVFRAAYDGQTSTTATAKATATPTPRPTATPRPSTAGSATVSGMGTSAKKVTLPRGTYEVEVQWENNVMRAFGATTAGIIQVQLLNVEDFGCRFLVIGELAASGSQTHFCEHDGGELRIQVEAQASAEWTIRFVRDSAS